MGVIIGFAAEPGRRARLGEALYGITPTDPMTYAACLLLLSGVSLLACYVPARRAARINPMNALRVE